MSYLSTNAAKKAFKSKGHKIFSSYKSASRYINNKNIRAAILKIGNNAYIIQRM